MKLALFYAVCEGEYEIAHHSLERLLQFCPQHQFDVYLIDDASPSHVGERLLEEFSHRFEHAELIRLPKSLGFWGTCTRMMMVFRRVLESGRDYDFVLRMDADLFPVRSDLGEELNRVCTNRAALYGCLFSLRRRDALLVLADLFPAGFRRRAVDGVMSRPWSLDRWGRTWWDDLGLLALQKGYRFRSIGGSFWLLGAEALKTLAGGGVLSRSDSRYGLHAADDSLLTIFCVAHAIPVIDFGQRSAAWQGVLGFGPETDLGSIQKLNPFVVHPLKNNPAGWKRRSELGARVPPSAGA